MKFAVSLFLALPLLAQTRGAQSTPAPSVFIYAPGIGLVLASLDPSITVTCAAGACTIKAVVPPAPPALIPVVNECYAVTAIQSVFVLKFAPASGTLQANKNGVILQNIGNGDWTLSGRTVTLTTVNLDGTGHGSVAGAGDGVCFSYQH